jgi:PhnB protein
MPKGSLAEHLDQAVTELLAAPGAKVQAGNAELMPLLRVAERLRALPRQDFKARLKSDLERKSFMAITTEPIAAVRTVASPRLTFKDAAKAIEFYKSAFGARETMRFEIEAGIAHAEIMIGDSVIMLAEEWPDGDRYSAETWGHSPVSMEISVPDVDTFIEQAVAAGAKLVRPVADQFYGYREGTLLDPFGFTWGVYTVKEEMSVDEMHRRFRAMMKQQEKKKPAVDPVPKGHSTVTTYLVTQDVDGLIDFMTKTFAAKETFRGGPGSEGGVHCEVKIGDSSLMVGGGAAGMKWRGTPMPSAFHIYVPDCDATYQRALQAGATSIDEAKDQEYGERSASVKDPAGDYWYIATHRGPTYIPQGLHTVNAYLHPLRAEPVINFLKRAFGAQELAKYASPDGVVHHAEIRVGNSVVEMGEAHGPYQPMPTMLYLYVEDCDAIYKRAVAAGGTPLHEPTDQPYGDRSGAVTDPSGNQWYIATHIKDVSM